MDWELSLQQKAGSCRQSLKISVRASGIRCPTRFRPWAEPVLVLHKWYQSDWPLHADTPQMTQSATMMSPTHNTTSKHASPPSTSSTMASCTLSQDTALQNPSTSGELPGTPQPHLWHSIPPDSIYRQMTFFPRNIPEWNGLPQEVTTAPTPGSFATRVCSLLGL